MNILHIVPYFHPTTQFGGTPEAVFSLAKAQAMLGHTLTVLTTDASLDETYLSHEIQFEHTASSPIVARAAVNGLQVLYIKNYFPTFAKKFKFFTTPWAHPKVIEVLPQSLDILHFHEVNILGYRVFAQWAENQKIPYVVSTHGSFFPPTHSFWMKRLHRIFDVYCQRGWFPKCAAFFTTSSMEGKTLESASISASIIHSIPFGQPCFEDSSEPLPFAFYANPSLPTLLFLGRIAMQKGIELAFRSFELLWREEPSMRLLFCGPDEGGVSRLRKWAKQNHIPFFCNEGVKNQAGLYICPPMRRKHIHELFKGVDVTICPSPYESFGLSLVESLQCGVPVVATDGYGCLDFLPEFLSGLICISEPTPSKFKQAIQGIIQGNTELWFCHQALLPSWEEIALRVIKVYQQARDNFSSSSRK